MTTRDPASETSWSSRHLAPEAVARRYDRLARFYRPLSAILFLRGRVRSAAIAELRLSPGSSVLEIGCGTGANFAEIVTQVGPRGRLLGIDVSTAMLAKAEARAREENWSNVATLLGDVDELDFPDPFDAIFFSLSYSVLHDRRQILDRAWEALRPGGRLVILDAGLPGGSLAGVLQPPLRLLSRASVLGDPATEPWRDLAALGASYRLRRFPPGTYFLCSAEKPENSANPTGSPVIRISSDGKEASS